MSSWPTLVEEIEELRAEVAWLRGQHPERAKALSAIKRMAVKRGKIETMRDLARRPTAGLCTRPGL